MFRIAPRRSLGLLPILAVLVGGPVVALAVGSGASASTAPPSTPGAEAPEALPEGYVRLVDDTAMLTVVVPETWTVVDTAPVIGTDGSAGAQIFAATVDGDEFDDTFASGMRYFTTTFTPDPEAYFTDGGGLTGGCESIEVQPYEDPIFQGVVQVGTGCGEGGGTWNMILASPEDQSFTAVVQLQIETPDEQLAFDAVLASFTYAGDPTVSPEIMIPSPTVPSSSVPA